MEVATFNLISAIRKKNNSYNQMFSCFTPDKNYVIPRQNRYQYLFFWAE